MPRIDSMLRTMLFAAAAAASLPAETIEGLWTGVVSAPQGDEPIALEIGKTKSGHLAVTMWMPVMHVDKLRTGLDDDGAGNYAIAPLDTRFRLDGDSLVGTFALGRIPMQLKRGGEMPLQPAIPEAPAGPSPAWTLALGAGAWASPVVRDDAIYVGTTDGAMHAVRATDGTRLWQWKGTAPFYGAALATTGSVIALDDSCSLACLDRARGEVRWRTDLRDGLAEGAKLPDNPSYNHRTPAPILVDGTLFIGSADGGLYAIDPETGAKKWRAKIGGPVLVAPAVLGDRLIATSLDGSIVVVARADGSDLSRTKLPGGVVSTPAVVGGIAVVGCRDYMLYGLKVSDLSIAWRFSYWFSWVESTPSVDGGIVYVGSSDYRRISAIDAATGKALWGADVGGLTWGTPLLAGDTIFAGSSSQSDAILPHTGGLTAIDRATGAVKWRHPVALADGYDRAGFIGSLALAGDLVIGATADGTLVSFPAR